MESWEKARFEEAASETVDGPWAWRPGIKIETFKAVQLRFEPEATGKLIAMHEAETVAVLGSARLVDRSRFVADKQ